MQASKRQKLDPEAKKRLQYLQIRCGELGAIKPSQRNQAINDLVDECHAVLHDFQPDTDLAERLDQVLDNLEDYLISEKPDLLRSKRPATRQWLTTYMGQALETDVPIWESVLRGIPNVEVNDLRTNAIELFTQTFGEPERTRDQLRWVDLGKKQCSISMETYTDRLLLTARSGRKFLFVWIEQQDDRWVVKWHGNQGIWLGSGKEFEEIVTDPFQAIETFAKSAVEFCY